MTASSSSLRPTPVILRLAVTAAVLLAVQVAWLDGALPPPLAVCVSLLALVGSISEIRLTKPCLERVILIGRCPLALDLVAMLARHPEPRFTLVGIVDDPACPPAADQDLSVPVLGPVARLPEILRAERPDRIVVGLVDRRGRLPMEPLLESRLSGIVVEDVVDAYERLTGKLAIEALTPSTLIAAHGFRHSRGREAVRRGLSFVAAAAGLVVLAPLLGLIALAIWLDSGAPIIFRHERMGLAGRAFPLFKFRTMCHSERPTSEWACDNLHRVTRVGRWLRQSRLDELPQLFNILRGDMNLVGPRPHPISNLGLFLQNIPYYTLRASVRPGLIGWAQVRYRYANNLEEETEKMRHDLYYIKHVSLLLDLRVLLETIAKLLTGKALAPGQSEQPRFGHEARARRAPRSRDRAEPMVPAVHT